MKIGSVAAFLLREVNFRSIVQSYLSNKEIQYIYFKIGQKNTLYVGQNKLGAVGQSNTVQISLSLSSFFLSRVPYSPSHSLSVCLCLSLHSSCIHIAMETRQLQLLAFAPSVSGGNGRSHRLDCASSFSLSLSLHPSKKRFLFLLLSSSVFTLFLLRPVPFSLPCCQGEAAGLR